jgi:multicomponent Na+:H+ antiporter subunit A
MALVLAVVAHFAAGALLLVALRKKPVAGAVIGLVVLAATAALVVGRGIGSNSPERTTVEWIPLLGFNLSFTLDGFAVVMALLVSVLGFAVLAYSIGYFEHDSTYARFVGLFMAFAGSMTGLVLAADLFTMFVFWELTSICSFLLIGLNDKSESARRSAVRALLTTGAGGLCLLGGVGILQVELGTTNFVELVSLAPTGTLIDVAAVLLLFGAFTKSAQFPFHFWLPGAMAAPTPVSAYLHSATMVKAGIVLLARTSPVFADSGVWRWWVVIAGVATMLVGGWSALRQSDAKLLLAHSTVSQLGLLTVLFGIGSPVATYAGVAHLVAHAVFKAGLFLGVGVIDHEIGTRDVSRIGSARDKVPVSLAALAACTLSMAGIIPLFGFVTKEKSLVALLDSGVGAAGTFALWGVVAGSVLSVAYSARFLRALVTRRSDITSDGATHAMHASHGSNGAPDAHGAHDEHHPSKFVAFLLGAPVAAAAVTSIVFGFIASQVGKWLVAPSASLDVDAPSKLVLWPGINDALVISAVVIAIGAVVGWRTPLTAKASAGSRGERAFDVTYDSILSASKKITQVSQPGSLPIYVVVTVLTIAVAGFVGLSRDGMPSFDVFVTDSPLTASVALLTAVLTVGVAVVSARFTAAVFLGGVGYGIAVLFLMRGAPDLALTQVLVETLTIVIFLLAMRSMPKKFIPASKWPSAPVRVLVSVAVGVLLPLVALAVYSARRAPSVSDEYFARSVNEAGGANVVNVILVDFRGYDTMGEITVLAVAALGVVNLVRVAERNRRARAAMTDGAGTKKSDARLEPGSAS